MNSNRIDKPHIFVSVGVLFNDKGQFLLTSRPDNKSHAGYWEFPGGKIEQGETPIVALARELEEELGIIITQAYPWLKKNFDYPSAYVTLFLFQVTAWNNAIRAREKQQYIWQDITKPYANRAIIQQLLPANKQILYSLTLPRILIWSNTAIVGESAFLAYIDYFAQKEPVGIILDEPALNNKQLIGLIRKINKLSASPKIWLHSHQTLAARLSIVGIHLSTHELARCKIRPINTRYCGASINDTKTLRYTEKLRLDYVIFDIPPAAQINNAVASLLQHSNQLPVYINGNANNEALQYARSQGAHGIVLYCNTAE